MSNPHVARHQRLLLAVFVLSGFAGLIYQSIWSHYLGLFLGHAAYAQALVLTLFMGGMAIGAAWVAKVGERWQNLVRAYAVVELLIGFLGLVFHGVFVGVLGLSYDVLIPAVESPAAVTVIKWLLAAALILPQTILLGMTFPLMSGGLIRRFPGQDGNLLGGLYFTNSIGAACGALVSAFLLVPTIGLPGASVTAGAFNIIVAVLAWWLARTPEPEKAMPMARPIAQPGTSEGRGLLRLVLWGTALSGAASFIYELIWIRMLAMAVGSTYQAFELMLAAFIAGIAFGGLWVRRRADRAIEPLRFVGWMQILMGLTALSSLVFYANAFEWVGWLMRALAHTVDGYTLFNLGTAVIAILIMMPAAFFAGTTLPLFTVTLLRAGYGERSIGRVYAWNTMGAILGVFLSIHLLIPALGLKLAFCVGALIDMVIGLLLLRTRQGSGYSILRFAAAAVVVVLGLGLTITQVPFDPMRLASGVFRTGRTHLDPAEKVLFYRDGKTASVSVIRSPNGSTRIATNGKVDASATTADGVGPQYDEPTMMVIAAAPLALHANPERIGVIGFGSGMSTHTLLGDSRVGRVDTIEIESAMVQGARAFGKRVHRAYDDPRSHIVIDDAKAYFASQKGGYDIIISEPSNPWISGVGSLFSEEFYQFVPRQLKPGGLFVQWIQLYEINDRLIASILNAMTPHFGDYSAWLANQTDLVIVATTEDHLPEADYSRVLTGAIGSDMGIIGIHRPEQIAFRKVADGRILRALGRMYDVPANSDFHPLLSIDAPRTRYTGDLADAVIMLSTLDWPALELLGVHSNLEGDLDAKEAIYYPGEWHVLHARQIVNFMLGGNEWGDLALDERAQYAQLLDLVAHCPATDESSAELLERLSAFARAVIPHLSAQAAMPTWHQDQWTECRAHNPDLARALDLMDAFSQRDQVAMESAGRAWLDASMDTAASEPFNESALLAIMLARAAYQDWAAVRAAENQYAASVKQTTKFGQALRSLLLSMGDDTQDSR